VTARTLARAGMVVTAAFFVSRLLGYVRLIVITNTFGASADLDAYFAAFRLPDTIFQLVAAGALGSALIPVLAGLFTHGEDDRAWRVVSTVLNFMLLLLVAFSIIVAIWAPVIVPLITPGFDVVNTELTVRLTRTMLLSPILLALGAVASSVLNARGRFGAAAIAPSVYNLAIIGGAIFLAPYMGVEALAVGVVVGSLLHLLVQLPPVISERFRFNFGIELSDSAARQSLLLMLPRAFGLGAAQITFIVNTLLATGIGVGAVTAYNVAFNILQIPLGLIGIPLGVVLLPSMSRAVAAGSVGEFGRLIVRSLRLLLYIMIWITIVGAVERRQVVAVLFGGGFDARGVSLTADTLLFFMIGLPAHAMIVVLARAFYSGQDTRTPVIAAILSVGVNVIISITTVGALGLSGLALGIAVGAWFEAILLAVLLWQRTPGAGIETIVGPGINFLAGSAFSAAAAFAVLRLLEPVFGLEPGRLLTFVEVVLASSAAALTYVLYSVVTRIPELGVSINLLRSAFRRGPPQTPVS
jgi:putative peptidoglycan lipid II flippase